VYRLRLTSRARRELDKIPAGESERIVTALVQLENEPRPFGAKKLKGNIYRIREGDWRIIYTILDKEKMIIAGRIARRSEDTYDEVEEAF